MEKFSLTKLSPRIFRIVEDDPFHENPFLYLITGDESNVLIDSGCGSADVSNFIEKNFVEKNFSSNSKISNLTLINTHNHFDHVGGNHFFIGKDYIHEFCMGGNDQFYSEDFFNSLGGFVGCPVRPYKINRWLKDGEKIFLSKDKTGDDYLEVLFTPGHTPDSICLYYPKEKKLFAGDLIYRWADILLIGIKSSLQEMNESCKKLVDFFSDKPSDVTIACGHIDDSLDFHFLKQLNEMTGKILRGELKTSSSSFATFANYSNADQSLNLRIRRGMTFDRILKPFARFFFR